MRGICVVLLDGLGDRAYPELGGRSSSEAARTPTLDRLAAAGSCGLLWPLGPGRAPASELAHWAMLGQRPDDFPGRAVLEARGHGHEPPPAAVVAFAALRRGRRENGVFRVTGRLRDDHLLPEALRTGSCHGGIAFRPIPLGGGEAILELHGDAADDRLTDTDPFFRDRDPVIAPQPLVPGAAPAAAAVAAWTRSTLTTLPDGDEAIATLKWWGRPRPCPPFLERAGLGGAIVGASPFLAGLAATLGLAFVGIADTGDPAADLAARLVAAAGALASGAGFVWVHTKAVDEAGHTKDPHARVRLLEALDPALAVLEEGPFATAACCVTGDHATPAVAEVIHAGDPVPLVLRGPGVRADAVRAFGELPCRAGLLGHLTGSDVLPVLLNAADRPLFLGSRPTAAVAPLGHPAAVRPLEIA